jgi:hypothetical protein
MHLSPAGLIIAMVYLLVPPWSLLMFCRKYRMLPHVSWLASAVDNMVCTSWCMSNLHWLNIKDRNLFKLCLLVYKALHGLAPGYLSELCISVASHDYRTRLRSVYHGDLVVPRIRLTFGQRSFSYDGPTAWNALPAHLKDHSLTLTAFKRGLKTHFLSKH